MRKDAVQPLPVNSYTEVVRPTSTPPKSVSSAGRRATISDVALAAGVSKQTVTRAMNDMAGIKAETRDRVRALAFDLGYVPSRFAKGLAQGALTSVGVAIPGLTNPFFSAFVSAVVENSTRRGWQVVINDYGDGYANPVAAVSQLAPNVDAIIGYLGNETGMSQEILGRRPLVLLDLPTGKAAGHVSFDYGKSASLALQHLVDAGHTHVTYLDWVRDDGLSVRAQAFARRAGDFGIAITFISAGDSAASAKDAVAQLLDQGVNPTAIVTFNDVMAAGTLKALAQAGRRVPEECSVVGMDGIALGELLDPELTTLALNFREVGAAAVELLERLLSGHIAAGSEESKIVVEHRLVVRQT